MDAKQLFQAGQLSAAIEAVTREVKAQPSDPQRRTFLFELLCFAGDFDRAQKQLDVISHQNSQAEWAASVYANLLEAERTRRRVYAQGTAPEFLLDPPEHVRLHVDALQRLAAGKPGEAIERLARVRAIRFDKTGTLTTGTPRVDRTILASGTPAAEIIRRGGALAAGSNHVYAQAIARWSDDAYPARAPSTLADLRTHPGRGVSGRFDNESSVAYLGSAAWMHELGLTISPKLAQAIARAQTTGEALSLLGWDGEVRALFVLGEQLRPTAALALADCARLGLDVEILTGDHPQRGELLSEILEFPVVAGQLPEDKVAAIHQARQRFGSVAMVGDGVNDAPALAAADLGIALGCGADVSRDSAQICLLGNDPARVAWTVSLARRTVRIIRWNLVWAFGYNAVGVGLAAAGWLNPAWAALAMVVSSALVIGNCLRLQVGGRDVTNQPPFVRDMVQLPDADVSLSEQLETPLVVVR